MNDFQKKLASNILKASEYIINADRSTGNYIVTSKVISGSFTKLFEDARIIERRKDMMGYILNINNKKNNKND